MRRSDSTAELRQSLPLIEEAADLLRRAPPRAWACYLLGTGPFVFALILFWSAQCGSLRTQTQPLAWALPAAALHLWMRVWQGRFCAQLADLRGGRDSAPWTPREWARAAVNHCRYGAPAFVALLPALLAMLPFGWLYAFYQHLALTAHAPGAAPRAWKAARHTPYQNHAVLAWLTLCGLIACVNVFSVALVLPGLVKLFVPVEWAFTRFPLWFLNSTALCSIFALTYLAADPLVKAVYVLRAFYGLSRATGEDLLTDWRALRRAARRALLAVLLLAPAAQAGAAADRAAPGATPAAAPAEPFRPAPGALSAGALDAQISRALDNPRYDWRRPVELNPRDTWLTRQFGRLMDAFGRGLRAVRDALRRVSDWWRDLFSSDGRDASAPAAGGVSVATLSRILTGLLLAAAAVLLVLLWRAHRRSPEAVLAVAVPQPAAVPDLADEAVTAEALPDDEWLRLAEQLRAAQDYRKAARAFFLALLACLGRRGLIGLRKSKTNADYLRELRRRTVGHAFDDQPFRRSAGLYEAGWYGDHRVTAEALDALRSDVEAYRHE